MKKTKLTLAALFFSTVFFAQTAMQITALGSYNSTWLFNKNISDKGDDQNYAAGWGYNYGLGYAIYLNEKIGIELNGLLNKHTGAYSGTLDSNRTYTSSVSFNSIDIPLLFKLKSESGAYFEVGPQLSMISGAKYTFNQSYYQTSTGLDINNDTTFTVANYFASTGFGAVIGFGINIKFTDALHLRTGLRFSYGFSDYKGVDALGNAFINPFKYKDGPLTTNSASGGLLLGLSYTFGAKKSDDTK